MKRQSVQIENLFTEDIIQYYEAFDKYLKLQSEDFSGGYYLAQKALALADRWNDIMSNASKLATADFKKTDIANYCYGKYRIMMKIHEHARMVWNKGEEESRRAR